MGEALPKLRSKNESRIGCHPVNPLGGVVGANGIIKRGVNLDGVEKLGEIRGVVKALRAPRRVDVPGPVRVRPARRADANDRVRYWFGGWSHGLNAFVGAQHAVPVTPEASIVASIAAADPTFFRRRRGQGRVGRAGMSTSAEFVAGTANLEVRLPRAVHGGSL